MEISTRHYGSSRGSSANIIELVIKTNGATITEDITDRDSLVDVNLIMALRDAADELEEQNNLISQKK